MTITLTPAEVAGIIEARATKLRHAVESGAFNVMGYTRGLRDAVDMLEDQQGGVTGSAAIESLTAQEVREDLPGWLKEGLKTCPTEREASVLLQAHSALQLLQAQRHCDRSPERSASQPE